MCNRTHLIIGAGKMGGALIKGWIHSSVLTPEQIVIIDPNPGEEALKAIKSGALQLKTIDKKIRNIRTTILAIKPQKIDEISISLGKYLPQKSLIISILAGTKIQKLQEIFKTHAIVRAMPNTPSSLGKGITCFAKNSLVNTNQIQEIMKLFQAVGKVYELDNEILINTITGISGSGPAYLFYLVETLELAAIENGLSKDIASIIARETIIGSAALLENSSYTPSELRKNVTSPKGTTEAALKILMGKNGLEKLIHDTVDAAIKRSKNLE